MKARTRSNNASSGRPPAVIPPVRNYTLDLANLEAEEQKLLNEVIMRDVVFNQATDDKVNNLRKEIQSIRKAGALRAGDKSQNKICARCKYSFWPPFLLFTDRGQRCMSCKFKICRKCRYQQTNGLFLCSLCLKQRQEKWLTGEWLHGSDYNGLYGSDLLRASLREKGQYKKIKVRTITMFG